MARVSGVLGGSWKRRRHEGGTCLYTSDRGAVFSTNTVDQAPGPGLREARAECLKGVKPIQVSGRGFVCVERQESDDLVVGNVAARGRLWLVLIVPSGETPDAELAAMVALLGALRK